MSFTTIFIFFLLLINNLTYAYNNKYELKYSGPFYLAGGVIQPNHPFGLDLRQLPWPGSAYKVTCDIENPNYFKDYPVVIWVNGAIEVTINQKHSSTQQYLLNTPINKFEAISRQYITFVNYDDTDPVYLTNCVATYSTE